MPTFHHPRRVQVDTGGPPLVPILGAVALVVIAAALEAVGAWASSVLGALGAVPVPVAALVPGALGFAGCGYLLGRVRVVQLYRRTARSPIAGPPAAVILERPAPGGLDANRHKALPAARTQTPDYAPIAHEALKLGNAGGTVPIVTAALARRRIQQRRDGAGYSRRYYANLRAAALEPYGDACACCASTEALTIDHIAGDGGAQRQVFTSSSALYRWIIANGHPASFQILCGPCNRSKGNGPQCKLDHAPRRAEVRR